MAVFSTAFGSCGSSSTLRKLSSPTQVAGCTRFVCCSDMITVRTIGYHENAPKMASIGSRKTSLVRPPPRTQVAGDRRARRRGRAGPRAAMARCFSQCHGIAACHRCLQGPGFERLAGCRCHDTRPPTCSDYLPCADQPPVRCCWRLPAAAGCSRSASSAPPARPHRASGRRSGSRPPAQGRSSACRCRSCTAHLIQRHVDVRLDPGVGEVYCAWSKTGSAGRRRAAWTRPASSRCGSRAPCSQRLLVVEVDPLDGSGELVGLGVRPHGGEGAAAEDGRLGIAVAIGMVVTP